MKARTQTLRKENEARERLLFAPLRDHADDPALQRVDEILSLLVAADTHVRERLNYVYLDRRSLPKLLDDQKQSKQSERAYYQTLELLNIKLSRYQWTATLAGDLYGFRSAIVPAQRAGNSEYSGRKHFDYTELREYSEYTESFVTQRDQLLAQMGKPTRPERPPAVWNSMEMRMVSYLLEALDKGEISRFRGCSDCQNWFYATTSHQRFCGETCRRRYTSSSPEFKQKRRDYMKHVYRPDQKQRDQRSLAVAKGTAKRKKGGN